MATGTHVNELQISCKAGCERGAEEEVVRKRLLIVENNAKIGGIQKALVSLLWQIHDQYDITLLLLYREGALLKEIPQDIRVLEARSDFRFMGMAQADCSNSVDRMRRGGYAFVSKFAGRRCAVDIASCTRFRDRQEQYDVAISFSHISQGKSFYSGTAEYVLRCVKASKKICYIHCDYLNSGNRSPYSDHLYRKFDAIVCVSNSTRRQFINALPDMAERTFACLNLIDAEEIRRKAMMDPVEYDARYLNLLSVARLIPEKGIARFVRLLGKVDTSKIKYTIVGDGSERRDIEQLINEFHLENVVVLCGEQKNPYRYMKNADILVVPSRHEAAPIVFQEARALCLPVLTTRTTSADEMIGESFGLVVDNTDEGIVKGLVTMISDFKGHQQDEVLAECNRESKGSFIHLIDCITERE